MDFSERLIKWYDGNKRDLPWRISADPYAVWVSEVVLQQTRIDQGLNYYNRFLNAFPDVESLAAASEDDVLRLWQGLGYYARARNLHQAACKIVKTCNSEFPQNAKDWMRLNGVGPYTSAAIASIVYGEAIPALDGNGYRLLARVFALSYNKDSSAGKEKFRELAAQLIDANRPGDFNQAMMDLGSLVCKPSRPLCPQCPLNDICLAFQNNTVSEYPAKRAKRPLQTRYFNYFRITTNDQQGNIVLYIRKREENDIWKNLYDLPLLETPAEMPGEELFKNHWWSNLIPGEGAYKVLGHPKQRKHQLTHQTIHAKLYFVFVYTEYTQVLDKTFLAVGFERFEQLAKPRLIELLNWDSEHNV